MNTRNGLPQKSYIKKFTDNSDGWAEVLNGLEKVIKDTADEGKSNA